MRSRNYLIFFFMVVPHGGECEVRKERTQGEPERGRQRRGGREGPRQAAGRGTIARDCTGLHPGSRGPEPYFGIPRRFFPSLFPLVLFLFPTRLASRSSSALFIPYHPCQHRDLNTQASTPSTVLDLSSPASQIRLRPSPCALPQVLRIGVFLLSGLNTSLFSFVFSRNID